MATGNNTSFSFREIQNTEDFNPLDISPGASFTQGRQYGTWQAELGRKVIRFAVNVNNEPVAYGQAIVYPLFQTYNCIYLPYGPVLKNYSPELLSFLKKELTAIAHRENAIFVRLDPTPYNPDARTILAQLFSKSPLYTYHSAYYQPRVEWVLNLSQSEESIQKDMHKNTRYSVRTAEKKGVTTEIITENVGDYFEKFYQLMRETADRNGFGIHPKKYYETIFNTLTTQSTSYLVVTKYQDTTLVIDVIIVFGKTANYVFGTSSNEHRDTLPSYHAQWEAIKYAKAIGCTNYNFGGIALEGDTDTSWKGLTLFKKHWGGSMIHHMPFYDIVTQPLLYHMYNMRKLMMNLLRR